MRASRLSYTFLIAFLLTVFGLQWWQEPTYPLSLWMIVGFLGLFGIVGFISTSPAARKAALMIPMAIGISSAMLLVGRTTHIPSPHTPDFYADGTVVTIRGMLADDPDRRAGQTRYIVEADMLKKGSLTKKVRGKILLTTRFDIAELQYGDVIAAQGKLTLPENFDGFAYDNYLSLSAVYSLMRDAKIEPAGTRRGSAIVRGLFTLRHAVETRLNVLFPEPHSSLLAGLLIGSRKGIPPDLTEDFKTTGLTHLVAISGTNITMIVTMMGMLFFWLPLKWRFYPSVMLIAGFTILTGASASAVRASVMGVLGLLATQVGRMQTTRLTMLWTAFFMIVWNPKVLWYDAGFQLSYLALIGLTEIAPLLRPYLRWLPETLGIQESLCLTLSAQLLASSWIFYLFGQLSLIAPFSNLLAPPLVPAAMLFGALSVLLSMIHPFLGILIAALAWIPLTGVIAVATYLSSLPYAVIQIERFGTVWIVTYYFLILAWISVKNSRSQKTEFKQEEYKEKF